MVKIIKEELSFEESLKKKIEFICDFCNTTPKLSMVVFVKLINYLVRAKKIRYLI